MRLTMSFLKCAFLAVALVSLNACNKAQKLDPSITWSSIPISDSIQASGEIEEIISPYRDEVDSIMNEVIGFAAHDLNSRGEYESNLGTFVTRLTLEQSRKVYNQHVDVALMNHHGGLRADINQGDVTLGEVFSVMPFENEVLLLEVPGTVLLEVLERINRSGSSMLWPVEFAVTDDGPKDIVISGKPFSEFSTYILAISDYLANGGGGLSMLKPVKRLDLQPMKLRAMIVKEIRETTARGENIDEVVVNNVKIAR